MPPRDHDCAGRWRAIKTAFSKALRKTNAGHADAIWERRYRDHPVAGDAEYDALIDYVHMNPVRHGVCSRAADWQWSSLRRFVATGLADPGGAGRASASERPVKSPP